MFQCVFPRDSHLYSVTSFTAQRSQPTSPERRSQSTKDTVQTRSPSFRIVCHGRAVIAASYQPEERAIWISGAAERAAHR